MRLQDPSILAKLPQFSGTWEINKNLIRTYGVEYSKAARQIFETLDREIKTLPDSVQLSYGENLSGGQEITIRMSGESADIPIVEYIQPKRSGFLWLKLESLESFITGAVRVATAVAEEYKAK